MNGFFKKKGEGRSKERREGRKKEGNIERDDRKEGGKTPQREAEERFGKVPTFLQHVVTLNYELMYLLEHFIPIYLSFS